MEKLKLIRENAEKFKKHVEEIEKLEIQKKEKEENLNKIILQQNEENEQYNKAEKYLKSLVQKSSAENSGLLSKKNYNNKLHENLNNFVFNQIYNDSDEENKDEDNMNNSKNNSDEKNNNKNVFISFAIKNKKDEINNNNINSIDKKKEQKEQKESLNSNTNQINTFIKNLNEKLNINYSDLNINDVGNNNNNNNNISPKEINNSKNNNSKKENLGKVIEKYIESDDDKNNINNIDNQSYQPYTPNFKNLKKNQNQNIIKSNENDNEIIEEMKIKPSKAVLKINKALNENRGKKEYTAHTYSTIQKIKNINDNKNKPKKPGIFEKNILNKKYSGKTDKVALFKMYQNEWNKNLYKNK